MSQCVCSYFPERHYRVRRNGASGTSGLAVIFGYTEFHTERLNRDGGEEEINNLESFYRQLNLRVRVIKNKTLEETKLALNFIIRPDEFKKIPEQREYRDARLTDEDSVLFLAFTSHGNTDSILMSDEDKLYDDEVKKLLLTPKLSRIVKLVFFNKCRDLLDRKDRYEQAIPIIETDGVYSPPDMLFIYSCADGIKSLRCRKVGSLVLTHLPTEYEKYGQGQDILSFFREFNNKIDKLILATMSKYPSDTYPPNTTQIVSLENNTLRCKLYFLSPEAKKQHKEPNLGDSKRERHPRTRGDYRPKVDGSYAIRDDVRRKKPVRNHHNSTERFSPYVKSKRNGEGGVKTPKRFKKGL